ncbi:MAG: signal peptidase I [Candidatus Azambacteria bacterium]|nr:signal peptidase I [Candidatus Azambacteria bacterium]
MTLKAVGAFLFETFKLVLVSLLIIVPIRYFVVQPFFVLGASMEPTFQNGDYLIIDEISYFTGSPKRGDVIVFRYPYNTKQFYIKRIVGLPGEILVLDANGITVKNKENPDGFSLSEEYLPIKEEYGNMTATLGSDEYFVMGDNRDASSDSRRWGALKREFIIGKVLLRAFPFQKMEAF